MKLNLKKNNFYDIINIKFKVYSPLKKFPSKEDFKLIVNKHRLKNKKFFPFPIFLSINKKKFNQIKNEKIITAYYQREKVCDLKINSIYQIDKFKIGQKIFGVNDISHPGFKNFLNEGNYFLDCGIKNFNNRVMNNLDFTYPSKIKSQIKKIKTNNIAGFHTRNVPHKAHEWIHMHALKKCGALFIQPMIGQFKLNEYKDKTIIKTNKKLVKIYNNKKIIYGNYFSFPKYGGPNEALLHALVRKNYGCTHFMVGRDHAGISDYYDKYASQLKCKKLENKLLLNIIKFKEPVLCLTCKKVISQRCNSCNNPKTKKISGTYIRSLIIKKKNIPKLLMRPEISKLINKKSLIK